MDLKEWEDGERDGWTVRLEGDSLISSVSGFTVRPPQWVARFLVSDEMILRQNHSIEMEADRAQRAIVDAILADPAVAKEVSRRVERARYEGKLDAFNYDLKWRGV